LKEVNFCTENKNQHINQENSCAFSGIKMNEKEVYHNKNEKNQRNPG